jgi:periplasmic protein TonB
MSGDTQFLPDDELPGPRPMEPLAAPKRFANATPLHMALVVSVVLHAVLLTVQLGTPGSASRRWVQSKLEVILVNAKDAEVPLQAQALAQASLSGGGDGSPTERAMSPLPPSEFLSLGEASADTYRRLEALQVQQQELLTSLRRDLARLPTPDPTEDTSTPHGRELVEQRRLLLQQMAELERRINEQNAPPRQRYVSPATQEVAYAAYYDKLRRRIEERGTKDFPSRGGKRLYGTLTLNISVDADGQVLATEVVEASNTPGLDDRAAAIVRAAAPFGRFSAAMLAEAEVLVLSARFTFDREKGVQAELHAGAP